MNILITAGAVNNLNSQQFTRRKIMYDECIELIYKTKEIEDILKRYIYSAKDIILINKKYIEKNCDNLTKKMMSKKLNILLTNFLYWCDILNIDISSNYPDNRFKYIKNIEDRLIMNKKYIEDNLNKYSYKKMAKYLKINEATFIKYCCKLNIDINSNYLLKRRSKLELTTILYDNKKYIEDNPNCLTISEMSKKLNLTLYSFKLYCKELNIDIVTKYQCNTSYFKFCNNLEYIKTNPDNLSRNALCKKINIDYKAFKKYCKLFNIIIATVLTPIECETIIINNKEYIESNPDNLTYTDFSKKFNMSYCTFLKYCRKLKINIRTKVTKEDVINNLLTNKEYIELNPDNFSVDKMSTKFNISLYMFRSCCKKLDIDIKRNYVSATSRIIIDKLNKNISYITQNLDNLSLYSMCKYLNVDIQTFKKYCKKLNIHFKYMDKGKLIEL